MATKSRWFKRPIHGFTHSRFEKVTEVRLGKKPQVIGERKRWVRYW